MVFVKLNKQSTWMSGDGRWSWIWSSTVVLKGVCYRVGTLLRGGEVRSSSEYIETKERTSGCLRPDWIVTLSQWSPHSAAFCLWCAVDILGELKQHTLPFITHVDLHWHEEDVLDGENVEEDVFNACPTWYFSEEGHRKLGRRISRQHLMNTVDWRTCRERGQEMREERWEKDITEARGLDVNQGWCSSWSTPWAGGHQWAALKMKKWKNKVVSVQQMKTQ